MVDIKEVLRVFATELNERTDSKGVTYRHVALASRVTRGSMIHYKSGTAFPELYSLVLMADYLDCSVDELLGYAGGHDSRWKRISADNRIMGEEDFADYFRERLSNHMDRKFMDISELSRRSTISETTIDMYLSVHRWVPRTADFLRLCDGLECTPSELLGY